MASSTPEDKWVVTSQKLVNYCLMLPDVARDVLLPSQPVLGAWLTEDNSNRWKFHMATISIGVCYGFSQADLPREDSATLLRLIKQRILEDNRLGSAALPIFEKFMSAWWGLAHHPDPDNFDLGGFIGAWFFMSMGKDPKQCSVVLLRGLGAFLSGPHYPAKFRSV